VARLRVGLTGGIASGKSTVASWMREKPEILVVDADRLVAELYAPGAPGAAAVARLFGGEAIDTAGGVDKERMARRIFSDDAARKALEEAIHPLVRERFRELADAHPGLAVLEATRLVEAGYGDLFDLIVSVEAPAELRLERAVARGLPEPAARERLAAQGDGAIRRAAADRILDSSGDLAALRRQVDELLIELDRLDKAARNRPSL
jgi:dephospho-CoA kinase